MADERDILRESARRILEAGRGLADQIDKLKALAGHGELAPTLRAVQERVGAVESITPT